MQPTSKIIVSAVVAMAMNRVIGQHGKLPWHIPEDLKHFKAVTMGKPVIMGRRTFESIGRPLPGRTNIVISAKGFEAPEGVLVFNDFLPAITQAEKTAQSDGKDEIMIIGGAQIYERSLPLTQRIYLTIVTGMFEGDAHFPLLDKDKWQEVSATDGEMCRFLILERRS